MMKQLSLNFNGHNSDLREQVMETVERVVRDTHSTLFMRYQVLERGSMDVYVQEVTDRLILPVLKELDAG